jgi:hypothetical protein
MSKHPNLSNPNMRYHETVEDGIKAVGRNSFNMNEVLTVLSTLSEGTDATTIRDNGRGWLRVEYRNGGIADVHTYGAVQVNRQIPGAVQARQNNFLGKWEVPVTPATKGSSEDSPEDWNLAKNDCKKCAPGLMVTVGTLCVYCENPIPAK